jgi:hypothetical protein
MYSSPYFRVIFRLSSRRREERNVLLFVVDGKGFLDVRELGRGVFSLLAWLRAPWDSVGLRRDVVGGGR